MTTRLILVKHSLPDVTPDVSAHEWKLSDAGRLKAGDLTEHLKAFEPEAIVSSPEPKAFETAQIAARQLGLNVTIHPGLHEHKRSRVAYMAREMFERAVFRFFNQPDEYIFGDETAAEACDRFSRAVDTVLHEHVDKTIVIVSHGTVISLFVSRRAGVPAFSLWKDLGMPSFVVFEPHSNSLLQIKNID